MFVFIHFELSHPNFQGLSIIITNIFFHTINVKEIDKCNRYEKKYLI